MNRPRRLVAAVAGTAVVAIAFGAGALTESAARPHQASHATASGSVLDQAEKDIAARSASGVSTSTLQQAAIEGMLHALHDPWAQYYAATNYNQYQRMLSGDDSGIGVWVRRTAGGAVEVTHVETGSPAAQAGFQRGDDVVAVGDQPVGDQSMAEVTTSLRGTPGTSVAVTVRRDGADRRVTLARARLDQHTVASTMISPDVEMLQVAAFDSGVGAWVARETRQAQARHLQGIVLDLRDDPGGLLDEAVTTASAFLPSGPIVTYEGHDAKPVTIDATGGGDAAMPLVVLVNGGTASAAEVVAGALQDRGRAVVIGSQTFGKGTVQQAVTLPGGSAIELTVGHYLTPNGTSLDGHGITPDVVMPTNATLVSEEQRAIEVLSGLTADTGNPGSG